MTTDLTPVLRQAASAARRLGASDLILFGSRARGDARPTSDIDLAVQGIPSDRQALFADAVDELPTLLKFDLVFLSASTDPALRERIEQEGVSLMSKFDDKYSRFLMALDRLEEAIRAYEANPDSVVRDGAIQRFEFCTELAWKATREYLIDQGYTELNSPKTVMRRAFADGLITDDESWISLLNDRNLTSHVYDEATAAQIYSRIAAVYLPQFRALAARLA